MLAKENCYKWIYKWICHSNKPPVHLVGAVEIKQFCFHKLTPDTQNFTRKHRHIPSLLLMTIRFPLLIAWAVFKWRNHEWPQAPACWGEPQGHTRAPSSIQGREGEMAARSIAPASCWELLDLLDGAAGKDWPSMNTWMWWRRRPPHSTSPLQFLPPSCCSSFLQAISANIPQIFPHSCLTHSNKVKEQKSSCQTPQCRKQLRNHSPPRFLKHQRHLASQDLSCAWKATGRSLLKQCGQGKGWFLRERQMTKVIQPKAAHQGN